MLDLVLTDYSVTNNYAMLPLYLEDYNLLMFTVATVDIQLQQKDAKLTRFVLLPLGAANSGGEFSMADQATVPVSPVV